MNSAMFANIWDKSNANLPAIKNIEIKKEINRLELVI
jgi:hypothetical protein